MLTLTGVGQPQNGNLISDLLLALCARATYCENKTCSKDTLNEIKNVPFSPYVPPPVPLTTNLVASYSFDTDFTDYTGNNNLTANGNVVAGVTGGVVDDCAEFDGTSDYALAADNLHISGSSMD